MDTLEHKGSHRIMGSTGRLFTRKSIFHVTCSQKCKGLTKILLKWTWHEMCICCPEDLRRALNQDFLVHPLQIFS